MRALLVALALLLPGAAWAQGSLGLGGGVACYAGSGCNLGTGTLTAQGGTFGTLRATSAVALTGSGTALSVGNNAVFGNANTDYLTLSGGAASAQISTAGLFNFTLSSTGSAGFAFNGPGGLGVIIGNPSSPVTGRLNINAGESNNPIIFNTGNSSNANQGIAFQAATGVGSQIIFSEPTFTGAFAKPAANPYNCNGVPGYVLICGNGDQTSGGGAYSLNVVHYFGGGSTTGGRIVVNFANILTTTTANTGATFYQAGNFDAEMRANAGGTSTASLGNNFAFASYARLENGATYFVENAAVEHDLSIETGASAKNLHGVSVILLSTNSVAPSQEGIAFAAGLQNGGTPTLTCAFCVGRIDSDNPVSASGTLFGFLLATGESAQTVANGVDIHNVSFTGNSWNDGHVSFTGNGDALMNSASALATTATTGFLHLPNMAGAPTGTPSVTSPAIVVNTSTNTLNINIGGSWYHATLTAGAG